MVGCGNSHYCSQAIMTMIFAKQVAATLLARHACQNDDAEAFSKALAAGADLFAEDHLGSVWDFAVNANASKCFALILPHVNAISGPKAEQLRDIASSCSPPAPAGILLVAAPAGVTRAMVDAARAEIHRQEGQAHVFESIALGAVSPSPECQPPRRRSAL